MTEKPLVRAACYCRISSDPNDKRAGVTRQREDTSVMAEVNGWTVAEFYVDNDKSASSGQQRPEWDRLLGDIEAGKVDAVVVWNQDRGWRKMADLEILRPVFTKFGVRLATTNIGVIDFSNADDVFRAQVSTALSEMEVAKMRVRQLRAARQRAELGIPKWKTAFGYLGDTHQPDPVTAPLVAKAYSTVLAGGSISDVAREWNAVGAIGLTGKPWSASTVSLFLRSPRNAGLRAHNGEIVGKGTWPALVDESIWRRTQTVLNAPERGPGVKTVRRHLLTGLIMCGKDGCGAHLSGAHTLDKRITYACKACRGVSIRAEHVEPLVFGLLAERLAQPDAVDLLKSASLDEDEAEKLRTDRLALMVRLDEIADERADGLIDGPGYRKMTDRIKDKLAVIDRREQDQDRLRIFDDLPLGSPEVADKLTTVSDDRFRAIVAAVMRPVVASVGKGGHAFKPERVDPGWLVEVK